MRVVLFRSLVGRGGCDTNLQESRAVFFSVQTMMFGCFLFACFLARVAFGSLGSAFIVNGVRPKGRNVPRKGIPGLCRNYQLLQVNLA